MKKLLFMLMLLPLAGYSQNPIVKWHGIKVNYNPTAHPSYFDNSQNSITADDISGQGINFVTGYYGFESTGWTTAANGPDLNTYYLLTVSPKIGKQIVLSQLQLGYHGPCKKMRVSYQKSSSSSLSFDNPTTETINNIVSNSNDASLTVDLSGTNATVVYGETLQIRIYLYQNTSSGSTFYLRNNPQDAATASGYGPALYGTISDYAGGTYSTVADTASTTETQSVNIDVLSNDTAGLTSATAINVTQPAHGTVTANGTTNVTYTPTGNYTGTDSFTYTVTNASGVSNSATVTVTINPFTGPTANADTASTVAGYPVTINVLGNDVAGDGTINTVTITGAPASGAAVVNPNKTITYTPLAIAGTYTITYQVTDSNNKTATATVTVTVNAIVNPTAGTDTASTAKNTAVTLSVTSNDTAGNGSIASVAIATNPLHGTVVVNTDKTVTYTPAADYTGSDSFTYTITNTYSNTAVGTVNMTVLQPTTGGPLCGTYYVGTGGDFTTVTSAVTYLNAHGVSCPVTFLLTDATYNNDSGESFPLVINSFYGSSASNTVTFKPAPYNNATIQVNDIWVGGSNYQAATVFQFNGADNIIFDGSNSTGGTTRNLTVYNNNSIDYVQRAVFWVASNSTDGATNITIKNTNIRQGYRNQNGNFTVGVYSGSNTISNANSVNNRTIDTSVKATANNSNLTVTNNDFMNVKQGVYINGGTTVSTNITITKNDLGAENNQESVILPITLSNVNTFEVSENLIYNLYRNTTSADLICGGINIENNTSNGVIKKNNLKNMERATTDAHTFGGIVLASSNTSCNILVTNNFILDVFAKGNGGDYSNGYGIIVDGGAGYRILFNTVALTKNQPEGGYSAALYVRSGNTDLDVRNNIFINTQTNTSTKRCAIMVNGDVDNLNAIFNHLDYNDYYSSEKIGYIANQNSLNITWPANPDYVSSLSGWQSALNNTNNSANANNKDTHSISANPTFISSTDLHLATSNTAINDAGTPIAEVTKDIDGQIRSTSTPDIGADEFGAIAAPDPGTTTGTGYCDESTTWNGATWSNGTPAEDKEVIFNADYTQIGGTLNACAMYVLSGAHVNFITNSTAIVVHSVNIEDGGTLTFESGSNLVQVENDQNTGTATVKRNGSALYRLDYSIWGSPVNGDQTLQEFSPMTLSNRFYTYLTDSNLYTPVADPSTETFSKGTGYLIRMPNSNPSPGYNTGATQLTFQGVFTGTPNTGNVYVPLQYIDADHGYNIVANPYPSPINARAFITANIDNIDGTLWVWRKTNNSAHTTYWTINLSGATANSAVGGLNDLVAPVANFDSYDTALLNTGQGFFVKAKNTNDLVFRNNMRQTTNSSYFFRSGADNADNTQPENTDKGRYWLNLTNADDDFAQILVNYSAYGTNGYDNGYDGEALMDGTTKFYSVVNQVSDTLKLGIQARPAFTINDEVSLGFATATAGTYKISIDHSDGLFAGAQDVYIVDSQTGFIHNLKESEYSFSTEAGTFENRFKIVYTVTALGTDSPDTVPAKEVIVYRDNNQIKINAPRTIKSVAVYDMLGRVLYQNNNVDDTEFTSSAINTQQQVVIVRTTLDNQQVVSTKVMLK